MSENLGSHRSAAALGAWLRERLTGPKAAREWRDNLEAAWNHLLDTPLETLLPAKDAEALLLAHLADESRIGEAALVMLRGVVAPAVTDLRKDDQRAGRYVSDEARAQLHALVSERGVVHPDWIAAIFREPAIEGLLSDTLYRALIDFSTIVPRLIQSMTPLGRFAKLGGFGDGGIGSRLVEELEKRLEPEIRRFLERGTRKALDGAARFSIERLDEPTSLEFRRNMVTFMLDQPGRFHAHALTEARLGSLEPIARAIARDIARSEELRQRIRTRITEIAAQDGPKPLRDVLASLGVASLPPYDVWASASFPVIMRALSAPAVEAWLGALALELLEHVGA